MGHSHFFLGFYKDIKIAIEGIKIKYLIFIIKVEDYNLILSQSFWNFIKFSQKYKLNKILGIIMHLHMH